MKSFKLPYGIEVHVKETLDGSNGTITSNLRVLEMEQEDVILNVALDAIESLILAHACAGIDIGSCEYREGVETSVEAIVSKL